MKFTPEFDAGGIGGLAGAPQPSPAAPARPDYFAVDDALATVENLIRSLVAADARITETPVAEIDPRDVSARSELIGLLENHCDELRNRFDACGARGFDQMPATRRADKDAAVGVAARMSLETPVFEAAEAADAVANYFDDAVRRQFADGTTEEIRLSKDEVRRLLFLAWQSDRYATEATKALSTVLEGREYANDFGHEKEAA